LNTCIINVDPNCFQDSEIAPAAKLIRDGALVAFPTETVYGLGANALDGKACDRVFEAKGRPHDNPLIVHIECPDDISKFAHTDGQPLLEEIIRRFMPGPLTVILPKKEVIPDSVTVGLRTVAIRCPEHPIAHALIKLAGVPIAAPSANLSGRPSPTEADHVIEDMQGRVEMILAGGSCSVGLESTVISLKGEEIHLLRPGYITFEDLLAVTDKVVVSKAVLSQLDKDERAESPGMKYRHYAPKAPVTMVSGDEDNVITFLKERIVEGCGIICFDEDLMHLSGDNVLSIGSQRDYDEQAARLFSVLRAFDSMDVSRIYARLTARDHLGLAISNRLLRACAFNVLEV